MGIKNVTFDEMLIFGYTNYIRFSIRVYILVNMMMMMMMMVTRYYFQGMKSALTVLPLAGGVFNYNILRAKGIPVHLINMSFYHQGRGIVCISKLQQ